MYIPKGYIVKRVYIIICDKCNEDITRPQGGDDVTSMEEAQELIREHQKVWHT